MSDLPSHGQNDLPLTRKADRGAGIAVNLVRAGMDPCDGHTAIAKLAEVLKAALREGGIKADGSDLFSHLKIDLPTARLADIFGRQIKLNLRKWLISQRQGKPAHDLDPRGLPTCSKRPPSAFACCSNITDD